MKLSLAWIYEHIDADCSGIQIEDLVQRFNETTAEIEGWYESITDTSQWYGALVTQVDSTGVYATLSGSGTAIQLPLRMDVQAGDTVLIIKQNNGYMWATMAHLGSSKDSVLPALQLPSSDAWHDALETRDYIIEVDNKSITHRPDMWGHRGFAREIAALYDLPLKPLRDILAPLETYKEIGKNSYAHKNGPRLTIQTPEHCKRLASAYVPNASWKPSQLAMASRLCRVDSKPINFFVDTTNVVMLDLGQPMHAFDAQHVHNNTLIVQHAEIGETLTVLDGADLELSPRDLILSDGTKPVSLVGVMGGKDSSVTRGTQSLLLESGHFDAMSIRLTAAHHKKRTDAAARFEKDLDPAQASYAIRRFMKIAQDYNNELATDALVVIGQKIEPTVIEVSHAYIETCLGAVLKSAFVQDTLEKLAFDVDAVETGGGMFYVVTVPPFRATKDITIKEDVVEEVGRFFGYKNVKLRPSHSTMVPTELYALYKCREIKRVLSSALRIKEIATYALFDESWLRTLQWEPTGNAEVQQPVSRQWRRLVTTLVPALFKAIAENVDHHRLLRFFEWARVWHKSHTVTESKVLSGVLFNQDQNSDDCFYAGKADLDQLFGELAIPVVWHKAKNIQYPWFVPHKTADIVCEGVTIGTFGVIADEWRDKVAPAGGICVFELDAEFLRTYKPAIKQYVPLSKFPDVRRDISMLLPLHVTAEDVHTHIKRVDERIASVTLVDFFHKKEWKDKKSLTFNYVIRDYTKTLTSDEVDIMSDAVVAAVKKLGAEVR